MQIVIDIDEDTYKDIKRGKIYTSVRDVPQESVLAIANGTPLPTDAVDRVTIKEYLESFEVAQPKMGSSSENPNKWIPVNEKLPNLNDYDGPEVWQRKVLITGYLSFCDEDDLFVTEAFASDVVNNCVWDTVVVAWMPLPDPYKQEVEE